MHLSQLLKEAVQKQASDLHIKVNSPPILRIGKELVNLEYPPLSNSDIEGFISELLPKPKQEYLKGNKEIDFAYTLPDIGRFRVNIFYQRGLPGIVMRRIKKEFSDFSSLGLPDVLERICRFNQGIVIISGPARSGKSTTIAAMINYINNNRRVHIITIEDPIEFLHEDNMCIINQREIGIDTESYSTALKYVMREDPDLVFIGELRDKESFQTALNIAETGHLIFTTLHAGSTNFAAERILNYFTLEQRDQIRMQLANNLSSIISQQLLTKKDGQGLVPAVEVMISNGIVQKLIRDNRLNKLSAAIELGSNEGMQTFNQVLLKLVQSNQISQEVALTKSPNPEVLKLNLQGIFLDDAKKILEG